MALKYIRDYNTWYIEEANKKWEDKEYRRKCLENAITYEKAILQINIELAIEDYNALI
jgi:hypothetical protein